MATTSVWNKVRGWRRVKNGLWVFNICLVLYIFFIPKNSLTTTSYIAGKINATNGINLRTEPNSSAPIIISIPYKATIEILNIKGRVENNTRRNLNWIEVKYGKYKGWVCDLYIDK